MRDFLALLADDPVDTRMAVPERSAPHPGFEIDVSSTFGIVEVTVLGSDDIIYNQFMTDAPKDVFHTITTVA